MPKKGEYVYHRKDGLWEARYVKEIDLTGKKKYGSVYARSCREAKEKRQNAVDNIRLHQIVPVTRSSTISQLVTEWLTANNSRLKPSSYQKYRSLFKNHIENTIGNLPVIYCTAATIQAFSLNRLETGISPATVNSILVLLHSCLKYGHRVYKFSMPDIIYIPHDKKEMRVFNNEEQKRLVEYLLNDMDLYKFGALLSLSTGLRIGELCGLEWDDISEDRISVKRTVQRIYRANGDGTEVHIGKPKTKTSVREIPIPPFLEPIIEDFRNKANGQKYVLSIKGTHMVEPRVMQYKFKTFLKDLKIENASFHTLRHSFATRCVEQDFEIKSLSEVLGHSNVQTTLGNYVHSSFDLKARNMAKFKLIP